jgi:hypothetical protein
LASKVKNLIEYEGLADYLPVYPNKYGAFKEFNIEEMLEIPSAKPDMEQILKISVDTIINSTKVIETPLGKSLEGQKITGKKIIIKGKLLQKIEYVADELTQSVHAAHFNIPFCTFIVLPEDYEEEDSIYVTSYIEDILIEHLDKRNIYKNITMLLDAEIG